jgi:hypothetical protein
VPASGNRDRALWSSLEPPWWEDRGSALRKAHRLDLAAQDAPAGMQALGQGLGVIIAHSPSGEALPNQAGQVVEASQRARAVNSGGHLIAKGHAFPFQAQGPAQGSGASLRHSSAAAENSRFPLDETAAFRESHVAKQTVSRLCRTCGPPLRRAVSFLGFSVSSESQITLRHRAFGTVAVVPSSGASAGQCLSLKSAGFDALPRSTAASRVCSAESRRVNVEAFKHQYASDAYVAMWKTPEGTWLSDSLVVIATIPMRPSDPGYSAQKANELELAAWRYARGRNDPYKQILFKAEIQ